MAQNRKLEAVKLLHKEGSCGLKEAKDYVDSLAIGNQVQLSSAVITNLDDQLKSLIVQGRKLEAIKLYKDKTGLGLKECKDYIDDLAAADLNIAGNSDGRSTWISDEIPGSSKPKSGCFIATACYGDYDAPEVIRLRKFRDERLLTTTAGIFFVKYYYIISPSIAHRLEKSQKLKFLVRKCLLKPLLWLLNA